MSIAPRSAVFRHSRFENLKGLRGAFQGAAAHVIHGINSPTNLKKNSVFWVLQVANTASLYWCSIDLQICEGAQTVVRFSNNLIPEMPSREFWSFRICPVLSPVEINLALEDLTIDHHDIFKTIAKIMSGRSSELDWPLLQHGESGNYWSEAAERIRAEDVSSRQRAAK